MNKLSLLNPKKIALFRALQLGDLLCAVPAIRALKNAFPSSEITLIGLPWAEKFAKRFPAYFSGFIHFPGYPGIIEQKFHAGNFISFFQKMNQESFDLLIQMHGNGSIINPMIAALGAKRIAGFHEAGRFVPDEELFMPYPEGIHEIKRHTSLMEFLGIPLQGYFLELPTDKKEEDTYSSLITSLKVTPRSYVCIHAGARDPKRWWPPEKFAYVADRIASKGYKIILTGTDIEYDSIQYVQQAMNTPAINLAGKTDLGTLALLIKDAEMVFSNDTGISHVAAAMKTPSIVVFLSSDPFRWSPLNTTLHHCILPAESDNLNYIIECVEILLNKKAHGSHVC